MTSSNSLGSIVSRLQGLKNVSGRRVMPEQEVLQNLEPVNTDVSGTSQELPEFSNFIPPAENVPEADLGGEITPQSYDVRANKVINPQEDAGLFTRFGQSIAKMFNPDEWESAQENKALLNKAQEAAKGGSGSMISDYFSPEKRREADAQNKIMLNKAQGFNQGAPLAQSAQIGVREGLGDIPQPKYVPVQKPENNSALFGWWGTPGTEEYNQKVNENAQYQALGLNPDRERAYKTQELNDKINKALEQPWQYSAYGSAEQVANSPALQAQFEEITNTRYEPQIAKQIEEYELATKGVEDTLNGLETQLSDRAESIKQRILNNQTTDADKYYIGLALLMPLLIGGVFGKEAGLGALGGGAKGIADVLAGRQKNIREDESSLLDINKQQAMNQEKLSDMALKRAELGQSLRKNLPEQHLVGMNEIEWEDPETGMPMRGIRVKPGLVAKSEYMTSEDGKKDMLKAANELSTTKTYVDEINDITENVIKITSQLKDSSKVWKGFASLISNKVPGALSSITEDVIFDGRKQNAGVLLEEQLGFLANKYGMAQQLGQLDRAAQAHIKKIMDNPTSTLLTPKDSESQILEIRKLAQKGLIHDAVNKGFYPEFIIADFEKRNNPLFASLNKKDEDKQRQDIKKKIAQGG